MKTQSSLIQSFWARKKFHIQQVRPHKTKQANAVANSDEQRKKILNEIIAYKFYDLVVNTPRVYVVEENDEPSLFVEMPQVNYATLGNYLNGYPVTMLSADIKKQLGAVMAIADLLVDVDVMGPSWSNILVTEDGKICKIDPAESNLMTNYIESDDYSVLVNNSPNVPLVSQLLIRVGFPSARFNKSLHEQLQHDNDYKEGLDIGYKTILTLSDAKILEILEGVTGDLKDTPYELEDREFLELAWLISNRRTLQLAARKELRNLPVSLLSPKNSMAAPAGGIRDLEEFDFLTQLNRKIDKFVEYTPVAKTVKDIAACIQQNFPKKIPDDLNKIILINQSMFNGEISEQKALLFSEAILSRYWLMNRVSDVRIQQVILVTQSLVLDQTKFDYEKHVKAFQTTFLAPVKDLKLKALQPKLDALMTEANGLYGKFLKTNNNNLQNLISFHAKMQHYLAYKYWEIAKSTDYGKRYQSPAYNALLSKISELCVQNIPEQLDSSEGQISLESMKKVQKFLYDQRKILLNNAEKLEEKYGFESTKFFASTRGLNHR